MVLALSSELLRKNLRSHITFTYDGVDNSFMRFFTCFKVCVDGFIFGCKHLIGLNAYHLKSKHLGVLLSANLLDGNNSLFTIALAVIEAESKEIWK